MKKLQKTIKKGVEIEGVGLFSGQKAKLRILPAMQDSGITFIRVDLPDKPRVPVTVENVDAKLRRTAIVKDGVEIETVEHLLSSIFGLELHNLDIEIDASEVPVIDGSSKPFVDLLRQAEIIEQDAPKRVITIKEPISVMDNEVTIVALPSENGLTVSYTLNYDGTYIGSQHLSLNINEISFASEIAPARTFCLKNEADVLLQQGLGKGANYKNTLVIDSNGVIDNELRFKDEFVRHKILDLLGDLSLLNASLKAHIVAVKSGHSTNVKLVKKIWEVCSEPQEGSKKPETWLDVREMAKILPHRYPMLLIDKVIELEGYKHAVGIKNVTINEPFFQGHFPGRPIMPGVLQIEAMAQLAGVLLMRKSENAKKVPVLLSIDSVKLRKTVVPGDQLRVEADAVRVKSRTAEVHTRATVDGELACEADMKFMLVDPE